MSKATRVKKAMAEKEEVTDGVEVVVKERGATCQQCHHRGKDGLCKTKNEHVARKREVCSGCQRK